MKKRVAKKRVARKQLKGWGFPRVQIRGFVISSLRGVIQSSRRSMSRDEEETKCYVQLN